MTYVVTAACADSLDRSCLDVCPVDCLAEGTSMMFINPQSCIDCGACEPACPSDAIYYAADLPAELAHYRQANAGHFTDLTGHEQANRAHRRARLGRRPGRDRARRRRLRRPARTKPADR